MSYLFDACNSYTVDDTPSAPSINESAGEMFNLVQDAENAEDANGLTFDFSGTTHALEFEFSQTTRSGSSDFLDRRFTAFSLYDSNGNLIFEVSIYPGNWNFYVVDTGDGSTSYDSVRNNSTNTGIDTSGTHNIRVERTNNTWTLDFDNGAYTYTNSNYNGSAATINIGGGAAFGYYTAYHEFDLTDLEKVVKPPENVQNTVEDDDTATVTWDENSSGSTPNEYEVDISTDGGSWTRVADLGGSARSHTETISRAVDNVRFRVRAKNGTTTSWSYSDEETTNRAGLSVTSTGSSSIDLSWSDPSGNDGTNILLAESSGSAASDYTVEQSVGASASTATITDLEHGERYFARVQATYTGADGTPSPVSNEVATTTDLPAPTLDSLDASIEDEVTVTYSLSDNSTDGDVLIERSTDGGSTWAQAGTVSDLSATSFTDTGRPDGTTHTYRVTRRTDHAEAQSGTASATTVAPAPTLDSLSVAGDVITATFTDHGDAEDHFEAEVSIDGGLTWSQSGSNVAALSGEGSQTSGDTAALLDGRTYDIRVRAVYPDASAASGSQQAATDLPDEDQPVLGNGVEDEIAVGRESQIHDNGSVRIQTRETGQSSWSSSATGWDEQVLDHATLTTQVTGREDGEQYEIRARSETADVTGAWTDPVSITTSFPGAQNLAVVATSATTADLEWDDVSDNEDGTLVERREQFRDGFGDWREVDDLPQTSGDSSTVQYTDIGALPDTTYQYRVTPYTEHTQATVGPVEATTADDGVSTDQVPAQGWHVIVEDTLGNTYTPAVIGQPSGGSKLNDLPRVEIPVERSERWEDSAEWERAPMRVYRDGERLPIEGVDRTRQEADRSVLVGVGGVELRERVAVDVIEEDAHLTAEGLLQDTSYAAHVDDPAAETTADTLQQSADSEGEWDDRLASSPGPQDVYETTGTGLLQTRQTAYFAEAEDSEYSTGSEVIESSSDRWSGGRVISFDATGLDVYQRATFEVDHTIPKSAVAAAVRTQQPGDGHHGFTISIDGVAVESIGADVLTTGESSPDWFESSMGGWSGDLSAGTHTLEVQFDDFSSASNPEVYVDALSLYDDRYSPGFSEQVTDNVLQGPDLYPSGIQAQTVDAVSVRQVVGGRLEADVNDTTGSQALAISNDSGGTWITASNSSTVEGSFASGSTSIRARFTIGGYDSDPSTSPAGRTAPQAVDLYSLYADLEDTPLLANRSWDQTLLTVLQDIASYGNFIFEVVWDSSAGSIAVEWTQAGQRTASVDPSLVDYSVDTDFSSVHRRAVIYGTGVPETSTITAQHGTWVALDHDWLQETGEVVESAADGTTYERSVDYELKPNAGELQALSTGSIADGEELRVRYNKRIRGTFEAADYSGQYETFVDDVPAITTARNADAAALAIVQEAGDPLVTASVTVDAQPGGVSLVEAIDLEQLPVGEPLEVWSVDNSPGEVTMQLGSREEISETISRIESRLGATSRKV